MNEQTLLELFKIAQNITLAQHHLSQNEQAVSNHKTWLKQYADIDEKLNKSNPLTNEEPFKLVRLISEFETNAQRIHDLFIKILNPQL